MKQPEALGSQVVSIGRGVYWHLLHFTHSTDDTRLLIQPIKLSIYSVSSLSLRLGDPLCMYDSLNMPRNRDEVTPSYNLSYVSDNEDTNHDFGLQSSCPSVLLFCRRFSLWPCFTLGISTHLRRFHLVFGIVTECWRFWGGNYYSHKTPTSNRNRPFICVRTDLLLLRFLPLGLLGLYGYRWSYGFPSTVTHTLDVAVGVFLPTLKWTQKI